MGVFTLGQGGGEGSLHVGTGPLSQAPNTVARGGLGGSLEKNIPGHEHLQPPPGISPCHSTKR
jgi:hypothetical protein